MGCTQATSATLTIIERKNNDWHSILILNCQEGNINAVKEIIEKNNIKLIYNINSTVKIPDVILLREKVSI